MIEVARIDLHMTSGANPKFRHVVHGQHRWTCNIFVEFGDLEQPEVIAKVQAQEWPVAANETLKASGRCPIEDFMVESFAALDRIAGDRPMKVASLVYFAQWLDRPKKHRRK